MLLAHELFWYLIDGVLIWIVLLLAQQWIFNIWKQNAIFRRKSLLKKMLPVIDKSLNDILKGLIKDLIKKETTNEKDKDLEPEDDDEDLDDIVDDFLK